MDKSLSWVMIKCLTWYRFELLLIRRWLEGWVMLTVMKLTNHWLMWKRRNSFLCPKIFECLNMFFLPLDFLFQLLKVSFFSSFRLAGNKNRCMIAFLFEENKLFCFQPFLSMIAVMLLRSENKLFVRFFWLSRVLILICNCEILFRKSSGDVLDHRVTLVFLCLSLLSTMTQQSSWPLAPLLWWKWLKIPHVRRFLPQLQATHVGPVPPWPC